MFRFSATPIARILFLFISGILTEIFYPLPFRFLVVGFCLFILATFIVFRTRKIASSFNYQWIIGILFNPLLILAGMLSVYVHTEFFYKNHFSSFIDKKPYYIIRLTEPPHEKEKSLKVTGEVESVSYNGTLIRTCGKMLVYLQRDSFSQQLNYGDYIVAHALPTEIEPPQNPGQFNYKRFLSFHSVYHQIYLRRGNWTKSFFNKKYWLFDVAFKLQAQLIQHLSKFFSGQQELGVASALLVGFTDYLDQDIIQAFSSAGALHVLSVSGMHVGLIYIFLGKMLWFLDKRRWGKHLKYFLLLSLIWFYSMITGFSPAVLRSAVMLSMVIISKWIKRDSDILNTMFASAFLLLLFNPFLITEVGFQLSYLAVFGIVYVHPHIVQLWGAPNKVLHEIWTISSVSFAAQLMTFPLGLLYFHQFPNLFMISNLIVIPVSTGVIYAGIMGLITFFIPVVSNFFWYVCYFLTFFLDKVVKFVESLWFAMINEISISVFETWLLYIIIFSLIAWLMYKRKQGIFVSLICLITFLSMQAIETYKQMNQRKIIFYSIRNASSAVDLVQGNSTIFITDDSLQTSKSKMLFFIEHHRYDLGIKNKNFISSSQLDQKKSSKNFCGTGNFISFFDKNIFVADKYLPFRKDSINKIKTDYILIENTYRGKIKNLLNYFNTSQIILSSGISDYREKKFIAELNELKQKYYSLSKSGALILDL